MSERQQKIELLNQTHQFPTSVMFKVIGQNNHVFVAAVVAAVRDVTAATDDPPYSTREARGGRHVAVTIEPHMQHAEQVLDVYARLGQVEGVVMLM